MIQILKENENVVMKMRKIFGGLGISNPMRILNSTQIILFSINLIYSYQTQSL